MPVKGLKDIRSAKDIKSVDDVKGVHDIKGVNDIKGANDIKGIKDIEGINDHKGLFQLQEGLKEKGDILRHNLQSAQAKLRTGVNNAHVTLGENAQKLGENLKNVGNLPHYIEETLIRSAVEIGVRKITKNTKRRMKNAAKKRLKKTKSKLWSFPRTAEKTLQTGVSTTQNALGKNAQLIGRGLKKTPRKIKSFPRSIGKTLRTGFTAVAEKTGNHFKKNR